jgi:hypothetical protein
MSEKNKIFKKLPSIFQTEVERQFFDSTFEQLFSAKDSQKETGYVGRRVSGFYDAINDYFLSQPTKERTWYQLEPIAVSTDNATLSNSNEVFYEELINEINFLQGNTLNHDRLFKGKYYSFAPPIDYDKFTNFQAYMWISDFPAIDLPNVTDGDIQTLILNQLHYSYMMPSGNPLVFTNGLRVSFSGSATHTQEYVVEGVGTGIMLVEDIPVVTIPDITDIIVDSDIIGKQQYTAGTIKLADGMRIKFSNSSSYNKVLVVSGVGSAIVLIDDPFATSNPDYITIQRGSVDGNQWSRSNKWYHKDVVATTSQILNSTTLLTNSIQARRPIIEFIRDLELFDFGTRSRGEVNIASIVPFDLLQAKPLPLSVDGVPLTDGKKMIFLTEDTHHTFSNKCTYNPIAPPYTHRLASDLGMIPISDEMQLFAIVKRPCALPGGVKFFYNPQWYSVSDESNTIDFTVRTPGLSNVYETTILDDEEKYGTSDDVSGLLDSQYHSAAEMDTVDVHVNGGIRSLVPNSTLNNNRRFSFSNQSGLTMANLISVNIKNFTPGNIDTTDLTTSSPNYSADHADATTPTVIHSGDSYDYDFADPDLTGIISGITITAQSIVITTAYAIPTNSTFRLYVSQPTPITLTVEEYIWKVVVEDGISYLLPYENINTPALNGDIVFVTEGDVYKNTNFYFNETRWVESTNLKTSINQPPLFNLYYTNLKDGLPRDLSDFEQSNFRGSKIFSYKIGTETGNDPILGFPIEYKNLGQIADIVFENNLTTDRYNYNNGAEFVEIPGYYYYKKSNIDMVTNDVISTTYDTSWIVSKTVSKQRVIDRFVIVDAALPQLFTLSVTPQYTLESGNDVIVVVNGISKDEGTDFNIDGREITLNKTLQVNDVLEVRTYSKDLLDPAAPGYYEIPKQLENNPNNEEVYTYSANELTNHFVSIMENQVGFTGDALSSKNNYRDTARDISLGEYILQTENPMLKSMFFASANNINLVSALTFSSTEYTRFKDKLVKIAGQLSKEHYKPALQINTLHLDQTFNEIIKRINNTTEYFGAFTMSYMLAWGNSFKEETFASSSTLDGKFTLSNYVDLADFKNSVLVFYVENGKDMLLKLDSEYTVDPGNPITIQIQDYAVTPGHYVVRLYEDTLSAAIPSTPTKIGCHGVSVPKMLLDSTYVTPTYVIVGHDGSRTPIYTPKDIMDGVMSGTLGPENVDLRDTILLDFEIRIYNNLVEKFRVDYNFLHGWADLIPGYARDTGFTLAETNDIFRSSFLRWVTKINANYATNLSYDPDNWMTWNYRPANEDLPGNWKGIYKYFYDTITPGLTPWEMLGFTEEPTWWVEEYGSSYGSTNAKLWADLEAGLIRQGNRAGINWHFVRPGLTAYIPVDAGGANKEPSTIGIVVLPAEIDRGADWVFGDNSPVEESWMNSSEYRYVIMEKMHVMRPSQFAEKCWDPYALQQAEINPSQLISSPTYTRSSNSELTVHGETIDGVKVINHGYQRFITDRLLFLGQDVTVDFANYLRNLTVKLGHRYAGFTNVDTIQFFFEGTSTGSTNTGLIVPIENIDTKIHTGLPLKEYVYSGVVVRITEDAKYEVYGYDVLTPYFKILERDINSPATALSVGGTNANFRPYSSSASYNDGDIVQYNTQFYQSLAVQTVSKFSEGKWKKLSALPSIGGHNLQYRTKGVKNVTTVEYGTKFDSVQAVFDFLISYGDYLKSEGWDFTQVDGDTNVIKDWKNAGKDFAFWTTTSWSTNNTICISPIADNVTLTVSQGYPTSIEKFETGVYNILDQYGYSISPKDVDVVRDDQTISIRSKVESVGVYCLRITTKETENIFVFDNTTVFNDTMYDPVLMDRQKRLKVIGLRSRNWFGKLEANGYIISGNKLIPNFENLTDSIRDYYNSEVSLDNPQMEDTARHLIGYQNRDYLDNLQLLGDTQYSFYKGMLPEKGTVQPIDKLLRSTFIKGNENTEIYEEWAFRVGEYGSVNDHTYIEFGISGSELKQDPQLVQLVFPEGPSHTKFVSEAIITNATEVYSGKPYAEITPVSGDTFTTAATADLVLTENKLTAIKITNPGNGYGQTPTITIFKADGTESLDTALLVTKNEITVDDPTDEKIVIDIDDNIRWLSRPFEKSYLNFVPLTTLSKVDTVVKNAGYVHLDDIDFTTYDIAKLPALWADTQKEIPTAGDYVWVANANYINREWSVLKLFTGSLAQNQLPGYVVLNDDIYTYTPTNAATISDVTELKDADGKVVDVIPLIAVEAYVFKNVRFSTLADAQASGEPKAWVDNAGAGWAVYASGNYTTPARKEGPLVDSELFDIMHVYSRDTGKTIIDVPVYDPFKGFIPGIADKNLTYKNDMDPTRYSVAADPTMLDDSNSFDSREVGHLWWDTSKAKYLYYEQGTDAYMMGNWGRLFPGSEVVIYEWVASDVPPEQYTGTGTPKNTTDYVVRSAYDAFYNSVKSVYFFWVRDKTTVPQFLNHRSMSALSVSRLISNPRSNGYVWFSFINEYEYIFNNLNVFISSLDSVIQINYRFTKNQNPKHVEWKLISKNKASSLIPDRYWAKMTDSLVGFDSMGRIVPDPKLSVFEKYGNRVRPRQTWFEDITMARKVFVQNANSHLISIQLKDIDPLWNADLPTNDYWEYVDWFEVGYNETNTVPLMEVESLSDLSSADKEYLGQGGIVKVYVLDNSTYYSYDMANNVFIIVRREKTAMQLKSTIYTVTYNMALNLEIREILDALSGRIFINDYIVYKNNMFFAMVTYAFSEQQDIDWAFKTTYINLSQAGEELTHDRNYSPDSFGDFISYVNEVKPYQTKIRDYSVSYSLPIDYATGTAWDMDSLAYTTDSDGYTHAVLNPAYPPKDVPRYYSTYVIRDSVQPGFVDKSMFVYFGDETKSGDGVNNSFVFDDITSVWKAYVNGRLLDRDEYYTDEDATTGKLIVIFDVIPPFGSNNITVVSGVNFTHTALEEMRLQYNSTGQRFTSVNMKITNPADIKVVNYDIDLAHTGTPKTGWGGSPWDTYGWNVPGVSIISDPEKVTQFTVYSGAANSYLHIRTDLTTNLLSFAPTGNTINYSSYATVQGINSATVAELADLQTFNYEYSVEYNAMFGGKIIDAERFEYLSSIGWDTEPWSSAGWDRRIVTPRIVTSVGPETILDFTNIANGETSTYRFNDVIEVDSATINGAAVSTTTSVRPGYTYVTLATTPAYGNTVLIKYHYTTDHNFEVQLENDVLDGSVFVPTPSDIGMTDELAVYRTSENVVVTVDTNGRKINESFFGDGVKFEFVLVQNLGQGVSLDHVTVDGVVIPQKDATGTTQWILNVSADGKYVLSFVEVPVDDSTIVVSYRIGALRQYYGADDARHYDGNTTNQVVFVDGKPIAVVDDEAGWDGEEWDNYTGMDDNDVGLIFPYYSGTPEEHKSKYLLPSSLSDVRIYVVNDTTTGVSNFIFQNKDTGTGGDYVVTPTLTYLAAQTNPSYERTSLKNRYRGYMQGFYPKTPMATQDSFVGDGSETTFLTTVAIVPDSIISIFVNGKLTTYTFGVEYTLAVYPNKTTAIVLATPLGAGQTMDVNYDTPEFTKIFNNSNMVIFNAQHHMQVQDSDPNMSQKILVEYELSPVSFKMHLTEQDTKTFTRIGDEDSTYLFLKLEEDSQEICVEDASLLPKPTMGHPGVVWIGGERITYVAIQYDASVIRYETNPTDPTQEIPVEYTKDILKGVLRHTGGTSIAATRNPNGTANTTYPIGKKVTSGDNLQFVPNADVPFWENSIGGLAMSTTQQAEFLRDRPGTGVNV